jgi:hypothetical protein
MKRPLLPILLAAALLPTATAVAEEVYFIRGGFNVFSLGMNDMADKLRAQGVNASAHGIAAWRGIAEDIVRRSRLKQVSYPIVYLGHSLGADAAPDFAAYLASHGIPTELVIGFDATGRRVFRGGAKRVIHYHASQRSPYVKGPGFTGTIQHVNVSQNGANHFNIEKNGTVQEMAMREVLSVVRPKKRRR